MEISLIREIDTEFVFYFHYKSCFPCLNWAIYSYKKKWGRTQARAIAYFKCNTDDTCSDLESVNSIVTFTVNLCGNGFQSTP